ncbi:Dabb family protein [Pararhizobium sp.]|uniref:Dabb family protein n=1 Tax=Pararhizobium sp. TaxID=1977563 RepID=UPI0027211694|nr:Dabb family protein [Pararhizobium sp.]MDO9416123.1 Dabb family protein [Pararhizobium sp.]
MIRHCVFIRFRAGVLAAERAAIFTEITALKARIPGFLAAHIGLNVSPETGMDKGYSDGFIVDFDGPASRDAYLADPEHQKTGGKIVAAAEGGLEGILVYDIDVVN